ncbi:MAG TPA: MBL fold metallo-hydrolase [Methanotrichaceae archaeon]|nr:MBL fold metallo-hydrolase [Methanotrichaceae archaeon]
MPKNFDLNLTATEASGPDFSRGSIFFVGTTTVILRYAGFTILMDPNFLHAGDHVHLGYGLTSKRLTNPAIELDELPPLDLCLLSHMHEDHFDQVVAARLDRDLPIITTAQAKAELIQKEFLYVYGLDTWDSVSVSKGEANLRITAMPGMHAPGLISFAFPPVMGSMLEFEKARKHLLRLYIIGDTLIFEGLKEIPRRYQDIDIMLLHLGGTRLLGLMVTMDAEQGIEAISLIQPHHTVPIHFNDYPIFKSPLNDFVKAVEKAGLSARVTYLRHGETYRFSVPSKRSGGWWNKTL